MKSTYNTFEELYFDLIKEIEPTEEVTIDFTKPPLNTVQIGDCTIKDYLQEELWDDAVSYGDSYTFTFNLEDNFEDNFEYSQLWKPKWNSFKYFLYTLYYLGGVQEVNLIVREKEE